jgi:tetratricopeptide (TPR) repeat protein
VLNNVGEVARLSGDFERARRALDECLSIGRELDAKRLVADTLNGLGRVECDLGRFERARELVGEAVAMHRALANRGGLVETLESLAIIAAETGETARALAAAAAAERARRAISAPALPVVVDELRRRVEARRDGLSAEAVERALAEGAASTLDAAIDAAL